MNPDFKLSLTNLSVQDVQQIANALASLPLRDVYDLFVRVQREANDQMAAAQAQAAPAGESPSTVN